MKVPRKVSLPMVLLAVIASNAPLQAQSPFQLELRRDAQGWNIEWPAHLRDFQGVEQTPIFELQRSDDLKTWSSVGSPVRATAGGAANEKLTARLTTDTRIGFYRLLARFPQRRVGQLAAGGAEVFGYATAFEKELAKVGLITPEEFASRFHAPTDYIAGLDWDPTKADFWNEFNTDPDQYNAALIPGVDDFRLFDFRLDPVELAVFKKNGFVVSERLGAPSCGEIFSRLWVDDLPVFIAADPILHAWHRSYDMILSELEETYLFETVRQMLEAMSSKVADAAAQAANGPMKDSVGDADYFLTVARSLLDGKAQPSVLKQDERVGIALKAIAAEQLDECFILYGEPRAMDFSQFKVRGHYTESERLGRYFHCVMWLGRTDLRVAGGPFQDANPLCADPHMAPPRELGTAIVLNQLLNDAGQFQHWQQFDRLIQTFVGWTDSMTFAQLSEILRAAGIRTVADVPDLATLKSVQDEIVQGTLGVQNIRSDWFNSPLSPDTIQLPRSFTVFGQKFILDSWALSQSVFDSIIWDEDGLPQREDKVPRRVPSALDVAFSVLGNNQVVPQLVARIQDQSPTHHIFRDGMFYQHNLAALRAVVDQHPPSVWNQNLYFGWLATLRELSPPVTDKLYPDAMRTRAWSMKDLNSQLASWTQLRHDTVLYAKQSYTGCDGCGCSYPTGFVEPRPAFWRRLKLMAETAVKLIQTTDYRGTARLEIPAGSGALVETSLATLQSRHAACFQRFVEVADKLGGMSELELRQEPFTKEQTDFLQGTMYAQSFSGWFSRWWSIYDGWYPKLFYRQLAKEPPANTPKEAAAQVEGDFQLESGSLRWDAIVTDVHTDVPCAPNCRPMNDPGSVLHEGIGRVNLLMIAINNGPNRCVYAGPVLSHYEFELIGPPQRMSDPEWGERWTKAGFIQWSEPYQDRDVSVQRDWSGIPPNPEWTRSYLVPLRR